MIDFLVCDDEEIARKNLKKQIVDLMAEKKYKYKIHLFQSYDEEFQSWISKPSPNKIYILDIKIAGADETGIDIARKIRLLDTQSILIFITQDKEKYQNTIIGETLQFFGFIDKFQHASLKPYLDKAISQLIKDPTLCYEYNGEYYSIRPDLITYIDTDKTDHLRHIHGLGEEIICPYSLTKLQNILGDNFISFHRSYLMNKRKIVKFSFKDKMVVLENEKPIRAISEKIRKEEVMSKIK